MPNTPLHSDVAVLKREVERATDEIKGLRKELAEMRQQAARWKGGLAVLLGLGGFFTVFLTLYEKLSTLFKGAS